MKHAYLFLLLFSIQLKAQQTFVSLEQFSQFALQQNLQLQQADLSTKIERQNVNAAISPLLPNINVSATLNDNLILNTSLIPAEIFGGKAGTFKEIKFGTKYNFNPNGTFSLNLINAANYQNLLVAKKNAALAGANSNVVRDQLKTQIAQAYYSYLLYKKNAEFSSRNLKNADSLLQIVTVRFNNQFVDELDLNRSRAAQILASNQFRQATLLVEKSLNTLKLLAAIPVSQPLEIRDEIAYSSNAPAFGNIQNRPSFIKAQLQNEVSELAVTREKLRFVPELSVYGNYGYNAQRNDLHFKSDQFYRNSTIGVRLDVPIFNGAIRYFNTQKAKLNRQMASLQMQQTQNELAKNDKDLLLDFAKAKEDVTGFRRQLEIAERNYALALVKYRNQAINYDNLVNVNNELLNAQQQLLQGEANYVTVQFQINLTASY